MFDICRKAVHILLPLTKPIVLFAALFQHFCISKESQWVVMTLTDRLEGTQKAGQLHHPHSGVHTASLRDPHSDLNTVTPAQLI
jgi:hypothetical protein